MSKKTISKYGTVFYEKCNLWRNDRAYNFMIIKETQSYFNRELKSKGYVFLDSIYNRLGIEIKKEINGIGWVYDKNNSINIRIVDAIGTKLVLDFNVDGYILDKLKKN